MEGPSFGFLKPQKEGGGKTCEKCLIEFERHKPSLNFKPFFVASNKSLYRRQKVDGVCQSSKYAGHCLKFGYITTYPQIGRFPYYFWHSNHGQKIALLMSFALNMGVFNGIQWPCLLS